MHDAWTVLGGWGVEPEVLHPVFGAGSVYLDTNLLMTRIANDNGLRSDWKERCAEWIAPHMQRTRRLAGWSTGAIIALACRDLLQPGALILISSSLSFCRTTEHPYGMRPAPLRAMLRKLPTNANAVVRDFRERCGLPDNVAASRWSSDELAAGLQALAGIAIPPPPAAPGAVTPLFVHGRSDAIIPFAAGEQANRLLGGRMVALDAPHACFVDNDKNIRSAIDLYLKETNHESV